MRRPQANAEWSVWFRMHSCAGEHSIPHVWQKGPVHTDTPRRYIRLPRTRMRAHISCAGTRTGCRPCMHACMRVHAPLTVTLSAPPRPAAPDPSETRPRMWRYSVPIIMTSQVSRSSVGAEGLLGPEWPPPPYQGSWAFGPDPDMPAMPAATSPRLVSNASVQQQPITLPVICHPQQNRQHFRK